MIPTLDTTFVLTSCARFDLLVETMLTFIEHNTAPIARYVVVEDSGDASVRDVLGGLPVDLDIIVNDPPIGQVPAIDRAYATVGTPYVFHCEDDWRFVRGGFIEASRAVLDARDDVSCVVGRRTGQNLANDSMVRSGPVERVAGVDVRVVPIDITHHWGSYSFNPGLRRLADWRRAGSFTAIGDEGDVSHWFKRIGMRSAYLEDPAYETTGWFRHVDRAPPQRGASGRTE